MFLVLSIIAFLLVIRVQSAAHSLGGVQWLSVCFRGQYWLQTSSTYLLLAWMEQSMPLASSLMLQNWDSVWDITTKLPETPQPLKNWAVWNLTKFKGKSKSCAQWETIPHTTMWLWSVSWRVALKKRTWWCHWTPSRTWASNVPFG